MDVIYVYDDGHLFKGILCTGFAWIQNFAEAIEANLAYEASCPLLICGERDKAGFTKRYNSAWQTV